MKNFYSLEPEVAGELGDRTIMDSSVHPPIVTKLHHLFTGWLDDELLECFPCYIVTEGLMEDIKKLEPSGCIFDDLIIEKSEQFNDMYPNKMLPAFKWLKVSGDPGKDDFGISADNLLVVSERVMNILKSHSFNECDVEVWPQS
jgi:hypothetical protein